MAFLCISLDRSSMNAVHLIDGELYDIDKYTSKFNDASAILKEFKEKIVEFKKIYNIDKEDNKVSLNVFLPDDKERFVLYKKHLIAFKALIMNNEFLKYALAYENNLLDKEYKLLIESDKYNHYLFAQKIKELLSEMSEQEYYDLVRRLCYQYENYLEDIEDDGILTIDQIYEQYLERKTKELENTGEIPRIEKQISKNRNPFVLFKHPKFVNKYGKELDKTRPIFILGGTISNKYKNNYAEICDDCEICFENKIYHPFNANVSAQFSSSTNNIYDSSLLVIVYGNDLNEDLDIKIRRAIEKENTVLIIVEDDELQQQFENRYGNYDTVIIRKYEFGTYESKKAFADIAAGIYINEYNKKNK